MGRDPEYTLATPTTVGDKDSPDTIWTNVGVGWKTKDSKGVNIQLNANPINGKLLLRKFVPKEKRQPKNEQKKGLL